MERKEKKSKYSQLSALVLAFCVGLGFSSVSGGVLAYNGSRTIQVEDDETLSVKNMDMGELADSTKDLEAAAKGLNAWAVGAGSQANGNYAMALGVKSGAYGEKSIAVGYDAIAGSVAENGIVYGNNAVAIGNGSQALQNNSVAVGSSASALDIGSVAVGVWSAAKQEYSTAMGYDNTVDGTKSVAVGYQNKVIGTQANEQDSESEGSTTEASAIGVLNTAKNLHSSAIGYKNTAGGSHGSAIGSSNVTSASQASAIGYKNTASGIYSNALGNGNVASGQESSAIGYNSIAAGSQSTAIGNTSYAYGESSVVIGNNARTGEEENKALGQNAVAIGSSVVVTGKNAIGIGMGNQVTGANSGAIGDPDEVYGSGSYAIGNDIKIGDVNENTGNNTFVLGSNVTTKANNSVVLGYGSMVPDDDVEKGTGVVSVGNEAQDGRRRIINVANATKNTDAATYGQIVGEEEDPIILSGDNLSATIQSNAGDPLVEIQIKEGKAEKDDKGFVTGDTVYNIVEGSNIVVGDETTHSLDIKWNDGEDVIRGKNSATYGYEANASAENAVALGYKANANYVNSVALGSESETGGPNTVSVGNGTVRRKITNVADGTENTDAATYGQIAKTGQTFTLNGEELSADIQNYATQSLAKITIEKGEVEAGSNGFVTGDTVYNKVTNLIQGASLVIGDENAHSLDIKWNEGNSVVRGENSAAYGYQANASAENAVALGYQANATHDNSVALGAGSTTTAAYTVSVGDGSKNRKIVNVANGEANTDVATYGQIAKKGQTISLNADTLSGTIMANDNKTTLATISIEKGKVENGNKGFVTGDTVYNAVTKIVQGSSLVIGDEDVHSLDIKWNEGSSVVRGENSAAYGYEANASGDNSVALGYGAKASGKNSVALGQGSLATAANTVSVGNADNQRKIVNVAAGTDKTDAVNFGQIGSIYGDGNVIKASTTNNVAENLKALDEKIGEITGENQYVDQANSISANLAKLDEAIRNMSVESDKYVTYDSTKKQINVGGAVDATQVNFGNKDGSGRKLTGIAAGAADTDAVNMGQLGQVSKDGNIIKASTTNNVAQNLEALDTAIGSIDKNGNVIEKGNSVSKNLTALDGKIGALDSEKEYAAIQSDASISENLAKLDDALKHTSYLDLDHIREVTKTDDAKVSGEGAIALGDGSRANGKDSISIGTGSTVNGEGSGAYGGGNQVHGVGSYAIGGNNTIGEEGKSTGKDTFVLGSGVTTTANNAVVLGKGSTATEDNVVSVGSAGKERRIVNVAPGVKDTDAANVGQIKDLKNEFTTDVADTGAVSAALAGLHPLAYDPDDKFGFSVAAGAYRGHSALALGSFYQPNEDTMLSFGGTLGATHNAWNAGISFKLGYGSAQGKALSRLALTKRVETLTKEKENLQRQVSFLWEQINVIQKRIGL